MINSGELSWRCSLCEPDVVGFRLRLRSRGMVVAEKILAGLIFWNDQFALRDPLFRLVLSVRQQPRVKA